MPPCHHNTPHSRYHNRQHTPTVNCWMIILNQSLGKTAQLSVCCRCQHNYKTSRYEEIESIMMTSRYDEGDGESKKILPRAISHAELSRRQLVVAPGGRVGRRSAGRSPGGGAGAGVRGGHRVGSLPRWNSLNVASLHHLWKQEINSSIFSTICCSSDLTCRPLTKVGRPIVSAGLLFLLLFFLLLFCFSLSLFGPGGE